MRGYQPPYALAETPEIETTAEVPCWLSFPIGLFAGSVLAPLFALIAAGFLYILYPSPRDPTLDQQRETMFLYLPIYAFPVGALGGLILGGFWNFRGAGVGSFVATAIPILSVTVVTAIDGPEDNLWFYGFTATLGACVFFASALNLCVLSIIFRALRSWVVECSAAREA